EMGLPYVHDPAVTRHLAAFLRRHMVSRDAEAWRSGASQGALPSEDSGARLTGLDAILFNGGVFQPAALRDRLVDVMRPWFGPSWNPLILTTPSLDLAVAWGAAWYGW